jgi:hypothetical protein
MMMKKTSPQLHFAREHKTRKGRKGVASKLKVDHPPTNT